MVRIELHPSCPMYRPLLVMDVMLFVLTCDAVVHEVSLQSGAFAIGMIQGVPETQRRSTLG